MDKKMLEELDRIWESEQLPAIAKPIKKIKREVYSSKQEIYSHLFKIFILGKYMPKLIHHWSSELHSFLPDISLIQGQNKLPTKEMLISWLYKDNLDMFDKYILKAKDEVLTKYPNLESNIEYDLEKLKKIYYNYIEYIATILSKKGLITKDEIEGKIKQLLEMYNMM